MPSRYPERDSSLFPFFKFPFFAALREKFKEGYHLSDLRADLMSGAVVSMVAIPLGMALAIASGVAPQYGLYTVIVAGAIVALLGGSRFQVTGPTAAFVVILAPVVHKFGLGGLLVAGLMAGIMLLIMGFARMGRLIQFIPYPVTTGFTTGIAVVIVTLQLKDFFGLHITEMPDAYIEKISTLVQASGSFQLTEFLIGVSTLLFLLFWPKINKKIPAPLVALSVVTVVTALITHYYPDIHITTIGTRFANGIPQTPPHFSFPWLFAGGNGQPLVLNFSMIQALLPSAFAITMLGAIESLLSAVVADGMAQTKHDPDAELVALGTGNIICSFFGGIAATGAIARTATNIRFGARSPLSSIFHAVFTLVVIMLFAPYVSYLPMAALAALLVLVAYNMSEYKHFFHILQVGPKSDVIVLLICFGLTVILDMVAGVTVGVVLASLLFMQRMAGVTTAQLIPSGEHPVLKEHLPPQIILYEIAGPLFFGAAEHAAEAISDITDDVRAVIFTMDGVPVMDVTGLVAFESALSKLTKKHKMTFLVGVKEQPHELLLRDKSIAENPRVKICESLDEAVRLAKASCELT